MDEPVETPPPPVIARALKWSAYLVANAIVAVIVKQILTMSGVLDAVAAEPAGWLAGHVELAAWIVALLISLAVIAMLFWLVSRAHGKAPGDASQSRATAPDQDESAAQRDRYLHAVKTDVDGRLAASLHHARFLDLHIDHDPAAVRPPWGYYDPERKLSYDSVWDAFEKSKRRLLLLGHPGAGKSTALLHIAARLVSEAEAAADQPVPVILNLSKFRLQRRTEDRFGMRFFGDRQEETDTAAFEAWVVGEVAGCPGLNRSIARSWLRQGRIALLLDGLDEFNDDQRVQLAVTLKASFKDRFAALPIALCSRTNEYAVLSSDERSRLNLMAAVHLQPLSDEQVRIYLEEAEAEDLLEALPRDPALEELSKTPLTLSMLVLAYGGRAPATADEQSLSETRFRLFESYVARMLQRQARRLCHVPFDNVATNDVPIARYRYSPLQTERWLGWLAFTMSVRMRTTFSPASLVPMLSIANDPRRQPINFAIVYAVAGLFAALCLAVMAAPIVPPTGANITIALAIIGAGWILLPWGATAQYGWRTGKTIIGTTVLASYLLVIAMFAHLLSAILPPGISVLALPPLLIFASFSGFMAISADEKDEALHTIGMTLGTAFALLAVLCLAAIAGENVVPGLTAASEWASIVVAWLCIGSGLFAALLGTSGGTSSLTASAVLGWFGVTAFIAVIVSLVTWPIAGFGWVAVLGTLATATLAIVGGLDLRPALSFMTATAPFTVGGGLLAGPGGAIVAAAVSVPLIIAATERRDSRAASIVGNAGGRLFGAADRFLLSPLAWFLLALFNRVPFRHGNYLSCAVDAFLLKRSGGELEFIHRLLRDYFALRELMPRLKSDTASRLETIRALGYQGEAALDMLIEFVEQGDGPVRAAAVSGLGHIPSPTSTVRLEACTDDMDGEVRAALIGALARQTPQVQDRVFATMQPIGDGSEIPAMLSAFPIESARLISKKRDFLRKIGVAAIDPLMNALQHRTASERTVTAYLHELESERIVLPLIGYLRNRDARIRLAAATALQSCADARAIEPLKTLTNDRNRSVRTAVREALASSSRWR
jgi:hypothetical protein